ncbi:peptidase domain-containing ABC transporter [Subsaximicrobium wynnwilliamsii]|uniref:Peptidase domain-containing ABC transporter n=1 Tax=Subsaximicrobium wynnwilliamsii TaxID=291179 RepID=A0A5C6ZER5_9FLAO|nr:peptidase domain-containing ABC transporter [Subsaximicrobium wynnwilliamsii]TXD82440.1 peptidase domain-containing ABC transporter [Subsaximicrobium wynnwilliamsii]TXD88082.1 peptidase domain-containing ABC transporter [Subsaximicrobium wynnwilliamsii]TXE02056.1 peptidase domain-containing ABC transporter [Subsaximicrobium wynnwilliamsii]
MKKAFPFYKQTESKDCGPTCIKIVAKHYGKIIIIQNLRVLAETTRTGSTLLGLSDAAESIGLRAIGVNIALEKLQDVPLPCILHWNKNHFVVLYKIARNKFHVSDPAHGLLDYTKDEFLKRWVGNNADEKTREGIVLLVEPTAKFYTSEFETKDQKFGFSFLSKYLFKYKRFLWQLVIGLIAASILQLIFPFLTQSIVDVGIKNQDIHFIYLILFAQLALFIGRTAIEIIRSWILLHLSTRINISLVSDFFIKLMNLPIAFFDTRMTGDILQRINDHKRIERILTTSSLNVLFSMVNLVVFSFVLAYYSMILFGIFLLGSFLYFLWIIIFLKKRKDLDYKRFSVVSQEQSKVIELINGMQEIKLHNAEKQKRWSWEFLQARLFKVSIEGLALEQYQSVGSSFINEVKNIFITVLSAKLVIDGEITLGMMLAISYIVGQLNSPIAQLINFIREVQDAKISLDRLSEIHNKDDEEQQDIEKITTIPLDVDIQLSKVSFRYIGSDKLVLKDLDLVIPPKKVTAIVGVSGSGKTTLMKLLLKFYEPNSGTIKIGNHNLQQVSQKTWRHECGVVMQEGYIFNDTIAQNIAVGEDYVDKKKLAHAEDVANISEFIETLPLSYNTKIGMEGVGVSTGQKQRLLIARAVYKNPNFLFFDEATSALDANNEKTIMEKLDTFFENKTVVVIAHRLSTVKHAHQIVVLDKGKIVEVGNHNELVKQKGEYYHLVKNQLELGK